MTPAMSATAGSGIGTTLARGLAATSGCRSAIASVSRKETTLCPESRPSLAQSRSSTATAAMSALLQPWVAGATSWTPETTKATCRVFCPSCARLAV